MYALDRKGLNYLAAQGVDVCEYFRPSQEEDSAKNFLFREHMLAISDVLIHALLFERSEPSYRISSMLHERFFKNYPLKQSTPGQRELRQKHWFLISTLSLPALDKSGKRI